MKKRIIIFLLYLLFWYLLFVVARVAFLITYASKASQLPFSEIIATFWYGFKLDIAIASYIALLPSIFLIISSFTRKRFIKYIYGAYTLILLMACVIIILGDLFMYKFWGYRLDGTPLFYMKNMSAATASVSTLTVVGGIAAILLITTLLYILYLGIFNQRFDALKKDKKSIYALLPMTLFTGVLMRGGIGIASLTTSTAYFSEHQFANHAAINPIWNVGFSITESDDLHRKYEYYTEDEVHRLLEPLHTSNGVSTRLLKTDRPNIIVFITESLTAKALEATHGRPGIMPELNKLVHEGVLFDQIYAASDRTDRGIAAVLAGYPTLPGSSPLKYQKLIQKLSCLPSTLNNQGYHSEFFYGGTLEFANYRSFMVQAGFNKMISDKDFPASELKTKWGAFDNVVFEKCLADTPDGEERFFKTVLTLTSHEPFETPVPVVIKGDDTESKYLNSLHYTDASFGEFIRTAKTRKWWDNTLIIIIADHGSTLPGYSDIGDKLKYHIPMIWLGGALNVKDQVISRLASQTDLSATLLSQLGIDASGFQFSKNILANDYVPYAFFTFSGGFGYLKPDDFLVYNTVTNTYSGPQAAADSINGKQGKAYLQSLYIDFFSKNK